jgi:LysR family malonate utilization transcriptional regulator
MSRIFHQGKRYYFMLSLELAGVVYTQLPGWMKKVYENPCSCCRWRGIPSSRTSRLSFERNREHDPNLLALVS